ncbi:hypothetical protein [Campylobacter concisus]|uniref:hypothetical protein n=1 Tax=Campylobacter concisus TaxID=199 RepID=UPI00112FA473|nr:hypothetical protein [Campylobacter concisus]
MIYRCCLAYLVCNRYLAKDVANVRTLTAAKRVKFTFFGKFTHQKALNFTQKGKIWLRRKATLNG